MDESALKRVRSFNRTVTERVGALHDHYLGRSLPLGAARLLWEIGTEGAELRDLRRKLGLDSAYLSRLLRLLERRGLVEVSASAADARVRCARYTAAGLAERYELDRRSDDFARSVLEPLSERQRGKLLDAMAEVERLLAASLIVIAAADPSSADAKWCFEQYYAELGQRFESGFDPTLSTPANPDELMPPSGLLLIASLRLKPVGCAALKLLSESVGEAKRIWVAPSVRGLGLGARLLRELESQAKAAGISILRLDTNRVLGEAMALYRGAGYTEIERYNENPYAHYWFEKRL